MARKSGKTHQGGEGSAKAVEMTLEELAKALGLAGADAARQQANWAKWTIRPARQGVPARVLVPRSALTAAAPKTAPVAEAVPAPAPVEAVVAPAPEPEPEPVPAIVEAAPVEAVVAPAPEPEPEPAPAVVEAASVEAVVAPVPEPEPEPAPAVVEAVPVEAVVAAPAPEPEPEPAPAIVEAAPVEAVVASAPEPEPEPAPAVVEAAPVEAVVAPAPEPEPEPAPAVVEAAPVEAVVAPAPEPEPEPAPAVVEAVPVAPKPASVAPARPKVVIVPRAPGGALAVKPPILGINREGWLFVGAGLLGWLILGLISGALGTLSLLFALASAGFFRDPRRVVPVRSGLVVSPADGVVQTVEYAVPPAELEMGETPRPVVRVFMNVFNVHVNRVPADGTVNRAVYRPGTFLDASLDKASEYNERVAVRLDLTEGRGDLAFVQIAGLVARRISNDLKAGQGVRAGQRFGLIRFGSRLDIYLPVEAKPLVVVGQTAIAGETVLADLTSAEPIRTGTAR